MQQGWTILFFIYAEDDETKSYANALIETLLQTNHHPQLNLLVFESIFSNLGGGRITGKLNKLEFDETTNTRRVTLEENFGEVNPGERSVLAAVLQHIKEKNLLREKFMLFTWDHGTGFGIFDGDPTKDTPDFHALAPDFLLPNKIKEEANLIQIKQPVNALGSDIKVITNKRTRFMVKNKPELISFAFKDVLDVKMNNIQEDDDDNEDVQINMLTVAEINSALAVLGVKTEIVIMLNCWMQMLENSLELEQTANWLVAAETVHFFAGYDYRKIINSIAADPAVTGEEIARITVESLPGVFDNETWKKNLKELVVTAVRPTEVKNVMNALDAICVDLKQDLQQNAIDEIAAQRGACLDLSKGYFLNEDGTPDLGTLIYSIDILNYAAMLAGKGLVSATAFNALKTAITKFNRFKFIGANFKQTNPVTGLPFAHGVSIFHPDKAEDFTDMLFYDFFYASKRIRMAKAGWGEFLALYKKNR